MFVHPSYILDLVSLYVSWLCAYGVGVLRVTMACAVPVYLTTDISA